MPMAGDQIKFVPPDAFSCSGWLATIAVSFPAKATTGGTTVTIIVSLTGLRQPLIFLAVKMYAVVVTGTAVGVSVFDWSRLPDGVHVKEGAVVVAKRNALPP